MNASRMASAALGLLGLLALGCQSPVHDDNLKLHAQNRELQARLSEEDARLQSAPDAAQLASLQSEIANRDAKIKELQASLGGPTGGQPDAGPLKDINVVWDPKAGTMTINLPGDVLFDSGKALIKPTAKPTLDKLVAALRKDYAGKQVRIEGFTDSDPIARTRDQWDDNWDLSYGRAKSVMLYLTGQGVDTTKVGIVANGSNKPRATKPASRRVEVVVAVR